MLIVGLSACRVFRLRFLVFGAKAKPQAEVARAVGEGGGGGGGGAGHCGLAGGSRSKLH